MSSPSMNSIIFNVAGGAVLLTVGAYMLSSYFLKPAIVPCAGRYPAGFQLTFDGSDGKPMTPIDLQARSGSREWGLLQNASVVPGDAKSKDSVLNVKLVATDAESGTTENGVGFTWEPHEIAGAKSACLSYRVFMPADFAFQESGILPGLFGASDVSQIDELQPADSFALRVGWGQAGDAGMDVRIPTSSGFWETPPRKTPWPLNRWVTVEQEVKLNTPGKDDGVVRLWIDGALTIDRGGMPLRNSAQSELSGVVADVAYARTIGAPADVRISPFVLQWQYVNAPAR